MFKIDQQSRVSKYYAIFMEKIGKRRAKLIGKVLRNGLECSMYLQR